MMNLDEDFPNNALNFWNPLGCVVGSAEIGLKRATSDDDECLLATSMFTSPQAVASCWRIELYFIAGR